MDGAMQEELARLILGELPEADRDRLEARLLAEPELMEQADAVEAELADAYARGELEARRREAFAARLRLSPRLRDRLAFSEAVASRGARPAALPSAGLLARLAAFVQAPRAWAPAAAALLATAVAGWLALELRGAKGELARLQAERDALRAVTVPRPERTRPPALAVFALGLGAARDDARVAPFALPRDAESVRLDVDLEAGGLYRSLRALLATEAGERLLEADGLSAARRDGLWTVSVTLPAARLAPGGYLLTLEGRRGSADWETAALREFRVVRP
jgi:hypothetical protein